MTTHEEIRNSPEYLEWLEQELLKKITHNRKVREAMAEEAVTAKEYRGHLEDIGKALRFAAELCKDGVAASNIGDITKAIEQILEAEK